MSISTRDFFYVMCTKVDVERIENITAELLEDLIWKNGGANSNIQPDDLKSAAEAVLKEIKGK